MSKVQAYVYDVTQGMAKQISVMLVGKQVGDMVKEGMGSVVSSVYELVIGGECVQQNGLKDDPVTLSLPGSGAVIKVRGDEVTMVTGSTAAQPRNDAAAPPVYVSRVLGPGDVPGAPPRTAAYPAGSAVEYNSASSGWIPTKVVAFNPALGLYDLECKIQVPPQKIEIVSTANAELLLLGAGTGICPEGPTLDLYVREGHIARNPGQGLTQCRKASAPSARAVVPPAGAAAAAFVRLSARAREEQAERAEKANAQERASRKTAMLSQGSPLQKRAGAALVLPSASFENGSAPEPSQSERSIPSLMLRSTSANSDAEVGSKTPVRTPGPDGPRGHKSLDGFMAFDLNDIK